MNAKTLLYAGGAFAAAALLFGWFKPAGAASASTSQPTAGVDYWLKSNAQQQQLTDAAIAANWKATFELMDKTQPDFWV